MKIQIAGLLVQMEGFWFSPSAGGGAEARICSRMTLMLVVRHTLRSPGTQSLNCRHDHKRMRQRL